MKSRENKTKPENKNSGVIDKVAEALEKLFGAGRSKRDLARAKIALREARKKAGGEEGLKDFLKELGIEDASVFSDESLLAHFTKAVAKDTADMVVVGDKDQLQKVLDADMIEKVIDSLRKLRVLQYQKEKVVRKIGELGAEPKDPLIWPKKSEILYKKRAELDKQIGEVRDSNYAAFVAYHWMRLRDLKKNANNAIIDFPSVLAVKEAIERMIREGKKGLLAGPTGTGKTELAQTVAENLADEMVAQKLKDIKERLSEIKDDPTKKEEKRNLEQRRKDIKRVHEENKKNKSISFKKVVGSMDTGSSEIFGKDVLKVKEEKTLTDFVTGELEDIMRKYEEHLLTTNGGVKPEGMSEMLREHKQAEINRFLAKTGSEMETKFELGPIYECARLGIPFILDEVNGIRAGILLKLNHLMTVKPGDKLVVQETGETITVEKGFTIICTGNFGSEYKDRFDMDISFLNRIQTVINVDYLKNTNSINAELGNSEVEHNEGFWLGMAKWMAKIEDQTCAGKGHFDTIESIFDFARFVRIIQDISAGNFEYELKLINAEANQQREWKGSRYITTPVGMREILAAYDQYFDSMMENKRLPFIYFIITNLTERLLKTKDERGKVQLTMYLDLLKNSNLFNFSSDLIKEMVATPGVYPVWALNSSGEIVVDFDPNEMKRFFEENGDKIYSSDPRLYFYEEIIQTTVGQGKAPDFRKMAEKVTVSESQKVLAETLNIAEKSTEIVDELNNLLAQYGAKK